MELTLSVTSSTKLHCPVCLAPWLLFPEQFMSYNHLIRLHGEYYAVP
jgi:hypothetical protein